MFISVHFFFLRFSFVVCTVKSKESAVMKALLNLFHFIYSRRVCSKMNGQTFKYFKYAILQYFLNNPSHKSKIKSVCVEIKIKQSRGYHGLQLHSDYMQGMAWIWALGCAPHSRKS